MNEYDLEDLYMMLEMADDYLELDVLDAEGIEYYSAKREEILGAIKEKVNQ